MLQLQPTQGDKLMRLFQRLGIYAAVGAMAFAGSTFTAGSSNAAEK